MPAPDSHLALTDVERAILVRWIEQGAEWKPHWAFIPPARPAVPKTRTDGWARSEIDRFVLATLESHGLSPSPEAPRETLLRRVSMDLTGLPPTLADIDAFVADQSPDAYERVVDRLLASPAYGERMAVEWLDLARYADSHGYQDDGMRTMWPWRDWVIGAFNRNLPLDQFITWQLAGDLLPSPTDEQRLATGFNRNHMQSQEGGIVSEEYRVEYVADRVNTLGRALLGVSVECARCHDHKYDPISQKDYFRLFSFFNSVNESGQIPYSGVPSPAVMVVDAKTQAALDRVRAELATLEPGLRPEGPDFDRRFATWLAKRIGGSTVCAGRAARSHRASAVRSGDTDHGAAEGRAEGAAKAARGSRGLRERRDAAPAGHGRRRQGQAAANGSRTFRQRAAAAGRQLHHHRERVRVLRPPPAVLAEPVGTPRQGRHVWSADRAFRRRDERQSRVRDSAPRRRHAQRRPASRRPRQLDRDRDDDEARHGHLVSHRPDVRRIEPCRRLAAVPRRRSRPDARAGRQPPSQHHLHDQQGQLGRCAAVAPGQAPGRDDRGRRLRRSPRVRPAAVGARHGRPRRRRRGADRALATPPRHGRPTSSHSCASTSCSTPTRSTRARCRARRRCAGGRTSCSPRSPK